MVTGDAFVKKPKTVTTLGQGNGEKFQSITEREPLGLTSTCRSNAVGYVESVRLCDCRSEFSSNDFEKSGMRLQNSISQHKNQPH